MTAAEAFVVDASAMSKRLGDEEHWREFCDWMDGRLAENARFLAPHLLRYELSSILVKLSRNDAALTPERREQLAEETLLGFQFADGEGAAHSAPPLSYYDAAYLALARSVKATLVTYDGKLIAAARKARIRTLSPGQKASTRPNR